jgi:predicted DNA-binding transcriptional regulator AlpA
MTDKRIPDDESKVGLHPNQFVRKSEGPRYFGYAPAQLDNLIDQGVIPQPVALNENGRARGWFGYVILEWQVARKVAPKAPANNAEGKNTKGKSSAAAQRRKDARKTGATS